MKNLLKFLGTLSPAHILFFSATAKKQKVGTDGYGNIYFEAAPRKGYKRSRRWVMYEGEPEASRVPPEWHGWLHHQTNAIPVDGGESYRRTWQKPPEENMTGTNHAYRPPGHALSEGKRQKATGDYEAWKPSE
jgi:NADH:ubiquinone oxidoreductase subunit